MRTGRGEFLHKTYSNLDSSQDDKVATERVLIQVAGFLRHELPIRLAHRIQDLEKVPLMKDMPSVVQVKDLYTMSFLELISFPKRMKTASEEAAFAKIVEGIYERHASVLVQMARGAFELRAAIRSGQAKPPSSRHTADDSTTVEHIGGTSVVEFEQMEESHAFLDRFYISRIGIRVLIGQYLSLRQTPVENYIGIICSKTSPYEIVRRAIDDASFMCTRKYGDAPEVIISGRLDFTFPYVPTHLHYIMLELLKNSMRATVDWHGVDADYPPIKVVIADGKENEDVVIKVSDEGGGIPRSNMNRIWSYLFTTADPAIQEGMVAFNENVDHSIDSPLAGLGYGLPISRSYARYFGGDLSIMSMEGYGTDAFVHLTRLG
jgi:pyruvate dehydrogenase kinase 2/3/4